MSRIQSLWLRVAVDAGADGITLHLREDRRHIVDQDLVRMREEITESVNLEMACTEEMLKIALEVKPDYVCLVPEGRNEVTTEGGLDVVGRESVVAKMVSELGAAGIKVSLFIDPEEAQIAKSADLERLSLSCIPGVLPMPITKEESSQSWSV